MEKKLSSHQFISQVEFTEDMDHSNLWDPNIEELTCIDFEKDVKQTLQTLAALIRFENQRVIDVKHDSLMFRQSVYNSSLK